MCLIFIIPDTMSVQQPGHNNTDVYALRERLVFPPSRKQSIKRISEQIDCYISLFRAFSYLVGCGDTTKIIPSIMVPMELTQSPKIDEMLFSGSESKHYIDPLEPLNAPYCTIFPALQEEVDS